MGLPREEGHLQYDKKSRRSVITGLPCSMGPKQLFLVTTLNRQGPKFKFFERLLVSPQVLNGLQPQNNSRAKVAHLRAACLNPPVSVGLEL